jgi:hypothetical protein
VSKMKTSGGTVCCQDDIFVLHNRKDYITKRPLCLVCSS